MNKILRLAFVAAFAVTSSLTFAQKVVTFESSNLQGTKGQNITLTKDDVTITVSNGDLGQKYSYRIYKSAKIKIEAKNHNTLKVVVNCDNYGEGRYLGDGFDAMEGMSISDNKETVTWTGDAASVEFKTNKHQVRAKKIEVTIKDVNSGITTLGTNPTNNDAPLYNLAGQRVTKEYKGVVIQNGKKFINK